jgi:hypothetical protein
MATTTNFGWETPDDTDLVKDGALAMRTLGNAIDASLVDLKGGTTGQVLAKASNTDMDFTWSSDQVGIPASIFDAKGDIIAASAADTAARLAVGANDTVLTADSSTATGLKWAAPAAGGGFTLLSTTTLSGSNSYSFTGFGSGYTHLFLALNNVAAGTNGAQMRIDTSSATDMVANTIRGADSTASAEGFSTDAPFIITDYMSESGQSTQNKLTGHIWFYQYNNDPFNWNAHMVNYKDTRSHWNTAGTFRNTWGGFVLSMSSGNFGGGTARLYGVK